MADSRLDRGRKLEALRCKVPRFFQIRDCDKLLCHHLYSSLDEASRALVKQNDPNAYLVELDTPGGAVIQTLTFEDCQKILRSSSSG
jgi:hypothetical protein